MNTGRIAPFSLVFEPDLFAENRSAMLGASLRNPASTSGPNPSREQHVVDRGHRKWTQPAVERGVARAGGALHETCGLAPVRKRLPLRQAILSLSVRSRRHAPLSHGIGVGVGIGIGPRSRSPDLGPGPDPSLRVPPARRRPVTLATATDSAPPPCAPRLPQRRPATPALRDRLPPPYDLPLPIFCLSLRACTTT